MTFELSMAAFLAAFMHLGSTKNRQFLLILWIVQLIPAFYAVDDVLNNHYYFLAVSLITTSFLAINEIGFRPITAFLKSTIAAQVLFLIIMFSDYKYSIYSLIDYHYYKISVFLTIIQLVAATDGDTRIFSKCCRRLDRLGRSVFSYLFSNKEAAK